MSREWLTDAHVLREKKHSGLDLALCVKEARVVAAATSPKFDAAGASLRSPITTLLQHLEVKESEGATLISTAVPSEMCKGMARLYGVTELDYAVGNRLMRIVGTRQRTTVKDLEPFAVPVVQQATVLPQRVDGGFQVHTDLKAFQQFDVPANVQDAPLAKLVADGETHQNGRLVSFDPHQAAILELERGISQGHATAGVFLNRLACRLVNPAGQNPGNFLHGHPHPEPGQAGAQFLLTAAFLRFLGQANGFIAQGALALAFEEDLDLLRVTPGHDEGERQQDQSVRHGGCPGGPESELV